MATKPEGRTPPGGRTQWFQQGIQTPYSRPAGGAFQGTYPSRGMGRGTQPTSVRTDPYVPRSNPNIDTGYQDPQIAMLQRLATGDPRVFGGAQNTPKSSKGGKSMRPVPEELGEALLDIFGKITDSQTQMMSELLQAIGKRRED